MWRLSRKYPARAKKDGITGGWKRMHNGELPDFYCSPRAIRVIKSRRMRWAGLVARTGRRKMRASFFDEEERRYDNTWEA